MKVSLVQYNPKWEDKLFNEQKISAILKDASSVGKIIIFPEMTLTGFSMNTSEMAEQMNGDSATFFANLAKKFRVNVFSGFIEKQRRNNFNSIVHFDESGKLRTKYRKIHPFSYSSENKFYMAGNKIVIAKINEWKIGLSICYDLRFPELFRMYAKKKVDMIINIANWPDMRIEHWRALLKARALENQCYVAGVNRVGKDPKLNYNGYSSLFDPMGKEIISLKDKEQILTAEIDKNYVNEVRRKLPFLKDIRLI